MKNSIGFVLAALIALQCVVSPFTVSAKGKTGAELEDACVYGDNISLELEIGDSIHVKLGYLKMNGKYLDGTSWRNASGEEYEKREAELGPYDYYYDDAGNKVEYDMDEPIPEAAFGKTLHSIWLLYNREDKKIYPFDIASRSTVIGTPKETDVWGMRINADKKTVTAYWMYMPNATSYTVSVPETATFNDKQYKVTAVGGESDGRWLKALKLPASIQRITKKAFYESTDLKKIYMTGNVRKIGKHAFAKIHKHPVFYIKADNADFKRVVQLIKDSGVSKHAVFKRNTPMVKKRSAYLEKIPKIVIKDVKDAPIVMPNVTSKMSDSEYDLPTPAYLGKRIFILERRSQKANALLSTEDGKQFTKQVFTEKFLKQFDIPKKYSYYLGVEDIKEVNGEIVIYGYGYEKMGNDSKDFSFKTKDGTHFYDFQVMDKPKQSENLKIGKYYVKSWVDDYDATIKKDKTTKTFTKNIPIQVSEDGEEWKEIYFSLHGTIKGRDYFYDDVQHRYNTSVRLDETWHDDTYMYFDMRFYGDDRKNNEETDKQAEEEYDWSESYVYRTKDMIHFEKLNLPGNTDSDRFQHVEEMVYAGKNGALAVTYDNPFIGTWYEDGFYMQHVTFCDPNTMKPVLTYDAAQYDDNKDNRNFTKSWAIRVSEQTGKTAILLDREYEEEVWEENDMKFWEEYPTSIFISQDGKHDFKEYKSKIRIENLGEVHDDVEHGYQILERTEFPRTIKYLLFSKDGFAHSFKVKVPKDTRFITLHGDLLIGVSLTKYFSIPLTELYSKMERPAERK
ncbi:MAG: hypothetical protein E7277_06395 [Lachnospiraceae bacterium]|nr:hypothetical protein [Lachnospiraceae bacterium]